MDWLRIQLAGPLAEHAEGLWRDLAAQGYTPLSAANVVRLMAHLSRWLDAEGLRPEELDGDNILRFLRHRKRAGYTHCLTPRGLRPVLRFLASHGVVPAPAAPPTAKTVLDRFLASYDEYLKRERDLAAGTARFYHDLAAQFLGERFGSGDLAFADLTAVDVSSFVLRESRAFSVAYSKHKVTALRSLLRFLFVRGDLPVDLVGAVPAVAGWRLTGLPKSLPARDLQQLLAGCDRRTQLGRRDYAILLLLVRMALRAREAAALSLDDIDWAAGEVRVHGKGRRDGTLPLPADVGEALVAYLRRRPRTACRRVFLTIRAPIRALGLGSIASLVRAAFVRAGLPPRGSHLLRHTAATEMLRRGATLTEVAQGLRHSSIDTTAIYAKVDRAALRTVVQPWPGAAP